MSVYGETAEALFCEGYNCAQAVLCAFEAVTGLERATAAAIASSFGGGLGRMREVCGAVSGAAMVLGLVRGGYDPNDRAAKAEHYRLVQEFARRFREQNGSVICRELLKPLNESTGGTPAERTAAYYQKRPCPKIVRCAADITAQMLGL